MGWKWEKAATTSGVIWGDKVGHKVVVLMSFDSEDEADAALDLLAEKADKGK